MKKVLLVNDSRFESIVLEDMLRSLNYDVFLSDEQSALDDIQNAKPDYVVVNYIMRRMRGDWLIGMIKLEDDEIVCILSSSNPIEMKNIRDTKIDGFLKTPADYSSLKRVLREARDRNYKRGDPAIS